MKNPAKSFRQTSTFRALLLSGILIIGFFNLANAQDITAEETKVEKSSYIEIKLLDGTNVIGLLIAEDEEKFTIKTEGLGEIEIFKSKIESHTLLADDSLKDGVYWHSTVNSSRSIFTPTGYGLKKGEGYYQNFMVFINQVSYGVTDRFSIGVGFEFASLLTGLNQSINGEDDGATLPAFMLTPKFSIPMKKDKWNLGIGGIYLRVPFADFNMGVLYGVSTWGGKDHNVTVGLGFGGSKSGNRDDGNSSGFRIGKRPAITLSGTTRLSKRMALVSENWFFSSADAEDGSIFFNSLGLRYLGDRVSFDLSLVAGGADGFYAVSPMPLIGVTVPFGKGWGR